MVTRKETPGSKWGLWYNLNSSVIIKKKVKVLFRGCIYTILICEIKGTQISALFNHINIKLHKTTINSVTHHSSSVPKRFILN